MSKKIRKLEDDIQKIIEEIDGIDIENERKKDKCKKKQRIRYDDDLSSRLNDLKGLKNKTMNKKERLKKKTIEIEEREKTVKPQNQRIRNKNSKSSQKPV